MSANQFVNMNEQQKKAVLSGEGPVLVLAGPGSGKTTVLTHRIQNLISKHHVNPYHILTITFTKDAALEMKRRTIALEKQAEKVVFGTFHSVFFQILKTSYQYSQYTILTEGEKKEILKEILYHSKLPEEEIDTTLPKVWKEISNIRTNGIAPEQYESILLDPDWFRVLYSAYEQELFFRKKTDFDGILLLCHDYLKKNPKELSLWQNRFLYVLIDEFQDIDRVQYEIVKLLVGAHKNIFAVGDDDQAIYGFRGASPTFMREFLHDFAQTEQIMLTTNYRSNAAIVEVASSCISHNRERFEKKLISGKISGETEKKQAVSMKLFERQEEETDYLLSQIQKSNARREEIAFLFRTNRQAARFAEILFLHKIPYSMREKHQNFYENRLIKDILAYLSFAHLKPRRAYFYRFMNKPVRYIKREAVSGEYVDFSELYMTYFGKKGMLFALKKLEEDLKFLRTLDAYGSISYVLKGIGYEGYARSQTDGSKEAWKEQEKVLQEFLNRAKEFKSCKEFLLFIEQYSSRYQEKRKENEADRKGVRLFTFHGSKGLEFKEVYLPFLNEEGQKITKNASKEELEEERRMFYVALTRAKERLCLSATENSSLKKSVFFQELLTDMAGKSSLPD